MLARGEGQPTRRQRRAPTACDFCRYRKMKCDNEKPECRNCREYGRECVYAELAKRPRPSTARILQLERENLQLQESLLGLRERMETTNSHDAGSSSSSSPRPLELPVGALRSQPSSVASGACKRPSAHSDTLQIPTPGSLPSDGKPIQSVFSPDRESSYHGPTSAVFDEKSTENGVCRNNPSIAKVPDIWVKRQLVAESANQRQLEMVNFLAGKLDFDGVDPELGMHLLSVYWNRQMSSGPVVYRTVFMRDMACAGPYFSKLLLHAIYFYACKYTSRTVIRRDPNNELTAGWMFRQRAVELLGKTFANSNITTVQALLIMSSALFSWCDEKSTSWLYAGMAFNMIIDLGIHVDAATLRQRFSEDELEVRLRVFWSAFVIDKLLSLYQGRPTFLRESGTNLPMKFMDEHEELELFNPLSYADLANYPMLPVYSISTFKETCKLSVILEKILQSLYSEKSRCRDPDDILRESNSIHAELEDWRKSLPRHLDLLPSNSVIETALPHTLALLAMFNILIILLHRPFVSEGNLHSTSSSIALNAFSVCSAAAFEIDFVLQTYERMFCLKMTPYIISYATYVSATIHVRLAAQTERGSRAHKALRRCLDVLEVHQTHCWSPRRAKRVIDGLVARLGVVVDSGVLIGESYDLTSSNIDIDAIIQTFSREQPAAEISVQQLPISLEMGEAFSNGSALQPSEMAIHDNDLLNEHTMPQNDDDMGCLYDPIFGINGSFFEDFDLTFGDDM